MKSKTIIISQPNNEGRGILTLYQEDDLLKGKLRLYNFPTLNKDCKLGVYHQQQVYTANLILKSGFYETSFVGDFDFNQDFYTALIDTSKNNEVILSGGTYAGYYFDDNSVFDQIDNNTTSTNQEENKANCNNKTCNKNNPECEHCVYKEYFYANNPQPPINKEEKEIEQVAIKQPPTEPTSTQNSNIPTILENLIPQFEYVFNNYSQNEELNKLIENGKFVQINEGEEAYSIGAIYENGEMKYICYAIKCNYNSTVPDEIGKFYQWVPLDAEDPLSEGYYIVYQDANDLKIIEV